MLFRYKTTEIWHSTTHDVNVCKHGKGIIAFLSDFCFSSVDGNWIQTFVVSQYRLCGLFLICHKDVWRWEHWWHLLLVWVVSSGPTVPPLSTNVINKTMTCVELRGINGIVSSWLFHAFYVTSFPLETAWCNVNVQYFVTKVSFRSRSSVH